MTIKEIYKYADKIGLLTFSTIYENEVHSRIAHFNGFDDEGIYFRTMANKGFGRQLKANLKITVCGHYGGNIENHSDIGAAPIFKTGYTFRLIGDIRHVTAEEIIEKAKYNKHLEVAARDINAYPAMADGNYIINKAKGEIYDFDFEKINRNHKLNRIRFSFGTKTFNPAGVRITSDCIACGLCKKTCSFDAIKEGKTYSVDASRCDDCGSCMLICPKNAIKESLIF